MDLSTTPGRLRLLLAVLVLLSLAWGALAAFTASQYSAATAGVVSVREPLSLDALQIYQRLSDANDAATTAFLISGLEPAAVQQRYLADLTAAETGLEDAVARGGAGSGAIAHDLRTLATDIRLYDGEVQTAVADNRIGLPLGAAYLREASGLMRDKLLPKAKDLYAAENASLHGTSAHATGLPLIGGTAAAGLAVGTAFCLALRWLGRRTNRVFNVGLLAAGAAVVVSLGWLGAAYAVARGDLLDAQARGSATVEALAQVGIAAQEAHADESLTLIDNAGDKVVRVGDETYQADYTKKQDALGPGPGTLLTAAVTAARGTPAAPAVAATVRDAGSWFAAHHIVRTLDDNDMHGASVDSVLSTAPGTAGAAFVRLSSDISAASKLDQAVFDSTARSASGTYAGLAYGLAAGALIMAAGCAWGVSRRLAEYR
ncbi:hypothetical protein EAS64_22610 [Trebonia kvetii]|uniref:Secreted protein n=1 Tax=Trebonia kvetii TaxID=2480626 RepID=A0A6P2BWB1_9ACTN|nr:hypothetical protein [Trebonia kvetii]TVZ03228.1 hypothetical protein EAS64_22610 [Trebonia kvetii]